MIWIFSAKVFLRAIEELRLRANNYKIIFSNNTYIFYIFYLFNIQTNGYEELDYITYNCFIINLYFAYPE